MVDHPGENTIYVGKQEVCLPAATNFISTHDPLGCNDKCLPGPLHGCWHDMDGSVIGEKGRGLLENCQISDYKEFLMY